MTPVPGRNQSDRPRSDRATDLGSAVFARIRRFLTASLRRQWTLGAASVYTVLIGLFIFDLVVSQKEFLERQSERHAENLSRLLAVSSRSRLLANDRVGVAEMLHTLATDRDVQSVMLLSPQGEVIGHEDPQRVGTLVEDAVRQKLRHEPHQPVVLLSNPLKVDVATPILDQKRMIGWARIVLDRQVNQDEWQRVVRNGWICTFAAILIGALFARWMAHDMTTGLYRLLKVAEATRKGRRDLRAPDARPDELGQLATGFNRMLDALAKKERSLIKIQHRLESSRQEARNAARRLSVSHAFMHQERNKLHTILHSTREGIVITDAQGEIILINPSAERLLQKSSEQIETEGFDNLVDDPDFIRNCLEHEEDGRSFTRAYKDRILHFYASTFREEGDPVGTAALIRDITEEERLKKERNEIIERAPFGIVVADDHGIMRLFNPEATRMFGHAAHEILGQSIRMLIPEDLRKRYAARFENLLHPASGDQTTQETLAFESEALRRDGIRFPMRIAVNRMQLDGRAALVGMIVDMTEEKILQEDLIRSEKMAGLGGMVAGVAHELNTPVGIGITAISELQDRTADFETLLQSEGISEEELLSHIDSTKRLVELVQLSLGRTAELVQSFKSVITNQSSERLRTFRPRASVEVSVQTLRHEFENTGLSIEILCDDSLEIRNDPGAFTQIVINLLSNSLLHGFAPGASGHIQMAFERQEDELRFIYRDDGRGMTEETCRRMFDPFFTTRRDQGSRGLGMHTVYNLVTQTLGGTISCQSQPGQGVCMCIHIPDLLESL